MAEFTMYEDRYDRNIYYECDECLESKISTDATSCPNCGAKITEIIDETEMTHELNEALIALKKNPSNREPIENILIRGLQNGLQRIAFENNMVK